MAPKYSSITRAALRVGYGVATMLLVATGTAHAAIAQLDFGVVAPTNSLLPGSPASISFLGGTGNSLVGKNIEVDNVAGLSTPLHTAQSSTCVLCALNFTTGSFTGYTPATQTWSFNGGGTISIVGGVDFADNTSVADVATGTTLLTGIFTSALVTKLPTGFYDFRIAGGAFDDTKHQSILSYYGLPLTGYQGSFNLSFTATPGANFAFNSVSVYSGDIINTPVPVPAALWLLGSSLIGLATIARRRTRHAPNR